MGTDAIMIVVIIAVILEALVQVVKGWVPEGAKIAEWTWPVVSAVLGVVLCVLASVDVLYVAGITIKVPYVGEVLTGVLISRGAGFLHDVWSKVSNGTGYTKPGDQQ